MATNAPCPHATHCEMFGLFGMQSALEIWKISFCEGDFPSCERYRRAQAGQPVPLHLMPSGALLKKRGER